MNELLVKIRFLIPSLPRAEKAFAQALLENPEAITQLTLAAIAAARPQLFASANGWDITDIQG